MRQLTIILTDSAKYGVYQCYKADSRTEQDEAKHRPHQMISDCGSTGGRGAIITTCYCPFGYTGHVTTTPQHSAHRQLQNRKQTPHFTS